MTELLFSDRLTFKRAKNRTKDDDEGFYLILQLTPLRFETKLVGET